MLVVGRQRVVGCGVVELCESEVEELHLAGVADDRVAGLDVAMNDPVSVRVVKSAAHLNDDFKFLLKRQKPPLFDKGL